MERVAQSRVQAGCSIFFGSGPHRKQLLPQAATAWAPAVASREFTQVRTRWLPQRRRVIVTSWQASENWNCCSGSCWSFVHDMARMETVQLQLTAIAEDWQ